MTTEPIMSPARVPVGRPNGKRNRCPSCDIRMSIGEPRVFDGWARYLGTQPLTDRQIELLLMAAAEYRKLSESAEEPESVVDFIDWIRPNATGKLPQSYPEFDGRSSMETGGGRPGAQRVRHSSPFPLPRMRS